MVPLFHLLPPPLPRGMHFCHQRHESENALALLDCKKYHILKRTIRILYCVLDLQMTLLVKVERKIFEVALFSLWVNKLSKEFDIHPTSQGSVIPCPGAMS